MKPSRAQDLNMNSYKLKYKCECCSSLIEDNKYESNRVIVKCGHYSLLCDLCLKNKGKENCPWC